MPKSMTGYGKSRIENDDFTQVWEVRGVNSRFLDLKWRLPLFLRARESQLEKVVREFVARGRLEVHLDFQPRRPELWRASLNRGLAAGMIEAVETLARERGVAFAPDLNRLLTLPHLWQEETPDSDPALVETLLAGLRAALADFNASRAREGKDLADDITKRLGRLSGWQAEIKRLAPGLKEEKQANLVARITAALDKAGAEANHDRLLQEAAILADKLDVTEELTRLAGHIERLATLVKEGGEIGKKLDFLIQEAFREVNTCGNKVQSLEVSRIVVDAKAELEKCREQIQNIE